MPPPKVSPESIVADIERIGLTTHTAYLRAGGKHARSVICAKLGSWAAALEQAGLVSEKPAPKADRSQIFALQEKVEQLERELVKWGRRALPAVPKARGPVTLVIGDAHFPFHCRYTLEAIISACKKLKPDNIVQMGDLYDFYAHSRFPKSLDLMTPIEEIQKGRGIAEDTWKRLRAAAPSATCYQLLGNHDIRPHKKILKDAPELAGIVSLDHWFCFPGVETILDVREALVLNGVTYVHGESSRLGVHAAKFSTPVVRAHRHRGSVEWFPALGEGIWEMDCGYIGNPEEKALSYSTYRHGMWTRGYGLVDALGPRFVPVVKP